MTRGFLPDTNVPSGLTRIKPDPRVARWLEAANDNLLYLSVISIGEFARDSPSIPNSIAAPACGSGSTTRSARGSTHASYPSARRLRKDGAYSKGSAS
jgi:hypothetical protein